MYTKVESPDFIVMANGAQVAPVASLADEYGGEAHIIEDDHCYVLVLNSMCNTEGSKDYHMVSHWFPEAVELLRQLPPLKRAENSLDSAGQSD